MNDGMRRLVANEFPTTGVTRMRRPFGVGVIAVLMFGNAVTAGLSLYFDYEPSLNQFREVGYLEIGSLGTGLAGMAIAVGLWFLQRWAWVAIMAVLGFDMALELYRYFYDSTSYVSMLLSVIAVFYMNQHDVRQAFGYAPLGNRPGFE